MAKAQRKAEDPTGLDDNRPRPTPVATEADTATSANRLSKEEELDAFRQMLLIRRFEERAGQMYGMGLIGGFCHLYIGQEAVVVGMQSTIKLGDAIVTS